MSEGPLIEGYVRDLRDKLRENPGCALTHYNLGIAFRRKGLESQAVKEFNTVLEIWPVSEYARAASNALARHNQSQKPKPEA